MSTSPNEKREAVPVTNPVDGAASEAATSPKTTPVAAIKRKRLSSAKRKLSAAFKKRSNNHRGPGFTQAELDSVLELLDEYLPVSRDEWEVVLRKHEKRFPEKSRTVESLRRKFASLYRNKLPTGHPQMPEEVQKAKHIRLRMTERTDVTDGEGEDGADRAAFEVNMFRLLVYRC